MVSGNAPQVCGAVTSSLTTIKVPSCSSAPHLAGKARVMLQAGACAALKGAGVSGLLGVCPRRRDRPRPAC